MKKTYTIAEVKSWTVKIDPVKVKGSCAHPKNAAKVLKAVYDTLDSMQEHFVALLLDDCGELLGFKVLSSGDETTCQATPRALFRLMFLTGAKACILSHIHPGVPKKPNLSANDIVNIESFKNAAPVVDLEILDHILFNSRGEWLSACSGERGIA